MALHCWPCVGSRQCAALQARTQQAQGVCGAAVGASGRLLRPAGLHLLDQSLVSGSARCFAAALQPTQSRSAKRRRGQVFITAAAPIQPVVEVDSTAAVSEGAKKALARAANATRRVGWFSFWSQLTLSVVSAGILLFSAAFTSQNGPGVALYLTLFGVVAGLVSTFWTFSYTRLARRLRGYSLGGSRGALRRVRKRDVLDTLERGCWINVLGMAATLLGLQATVGLLVAKTLTNATANPFLAGGAGSYNPVLALDVFLVQASTNTLLSHFVALLGNLWLARVISANAEARPASYGAPPTPTPMPAAR